MKYFSEKKEQIHLNPITYEIYDEMNFEDKRTSYLESLSSDDEVIYDDLKEYTPHDLNMYLVKAVQELSASVDILSTKVEALENA